MVLISLLGDRPAGLDVGKAGLDYEGAKAVLLGGFWAQLFSGVTLMVIGPLLAIHLRGARDARRAHVRGARRITADGLGGSGGAGMEEPAT